MLFYRVKVGYKTVKNAKKRPCTSQFHEALAEKYLKLDFLPLKIHPEIGYFIRKLLGGPKKAQKGGFCPKLSDASNAFSDIKAPFL
jgi:hypothetical protein